MCNSHNLKYELLNYLWRRKNYTGTVYSDSEGVLEDEYEMRKWIEDKFRWS